MDKDKFKDLIEEPRHCRFKMVDTEGRYLTVDSNSINSLIRWIIQRTVRITLQYPELAQEYLDSLPKLAVNENVPTINE